METLGHQTASISNLKYFSADVAKHKPRVHQLDFIGTFLQVKVNNRVFFKLDIRYTDYFTEYAEYFGRALRLLKSMYDMTNSGKLFPDELTEWLLEPGFTENFSKLCTAKLKSNLVYNR